MRLEQIGLVSLRSTARPSPPRCVMEAEETEGYQVDPEFKEDEMELLRDPVPAASGERRSQAAEIRWVPDRIRKALEASKDLEEYRKHRVFKYLHLFAGPNDVLKWALTRECAEARLTFEGVSMDQKMDKHIDLAALETYQEIDKSVEQGDWDGFHGGFPCGSFSMARWNPRPGQPGPVRSKEEIYGLSTNNRHQQREADKGTLATQTTWLARRQVQSCRKRGVPELATLKNPPGSERSGAAWDLPEIDQALKDMSASIVEFNTCAFQQKQRERWWKPAKWAGKLEGLETLSRVCKCPSWVRHVVLVGKDRTEAAGP